MDIIDDTRFKFLLKHRDQISIADLEIKDLNNGFVEVGGWKFSVSSTIYPEALTEEVIEGWYLLGNVICITICFLILFIKTADDYLREREEKLTYDNGFEPDVLELLRLCYWFYKCSKLEPINFNEKPQEIQHQFGNNLTVKISSYFSIVQQSSLDPTKFNNELQKELSVIETAEPSNRDDKDEFYILREDFLEKVSSYVSELMICFLLFKVGICPTAFVNRMGIEKIYDMSVQGIPSEVKTIIDKYPFFDDHEKILDIEIIQSLTRKKFWEKIDEAIAQKANIIFLSATTSSLGKGVNINAGRKRKEQISIKRQTERAIQFASHASNKISVVVVTTSIDYDRKYRITSFNVMYPITRRDGKVVSDPSKLTMKDVTLT